MPGVPWTCTNETIPNIMKIQPGNMGSNPLEEALLNIPAIGKAEISPYN